MRSRSNKSNPLLVSCPEFGRFLTKLCSDLSRDSIWCSREDSNGELEDEESVVTCRRSASSIKVSPRLKFSVISL